MSGIMTGRQIATPHRHEGDVACPLERVDSFHSQAPELVHTSVQKNGVQFLHLGHLPRPWRAWVAIWSVSGGLQDVLTQLAAERGIFDLARVTLFRAISSQSLHGIALSIPLGNGESSLPSLPHLVDPQAGWGDPHCLQSGTCWPRRQKWWFWSKKKSYIYYMAEFVKNILHPSKKRPFFSWGPYWCTNIQLVTPELIIGIAS